MLKIFTLFYNKTILMTEWNTTFEVMVAKSKCMEKVKEILAMFYFIFYCGFSESDNFYFGTSNLQNITFVNTVKDI